VGSVELGPKVEIKNMNSFRSVQRALEFEVIRQTRALDQGDRIVQETRGWDDDRGITVSQRSKELAHDYRYFPEPDLPPVFVAREWVAEIQAGLPELPDARRDRFTAEYGLSRYDAAQLSAARETADFFEQTVRLYPQPKEVSNVIQSTLFRLQKSGDEDLEGQGTGGMTPDRLAALLQLVERGVISKGSGRQVFEEVYRGGSEPAAVIERLGLGQVSDTSELDRFVDEVLAAQPRAVADYRAGKSGAVNFLAGQVMKLSRGKANPNLVRELIETRLR
jgi:aspartyl-tRNA(Asn)/glutamyl-tRNA(Gln) amidotransferase subunit B